MNVRPSRFTRLKVIAGYLMMLMLLSYALYYIYEEMQHLEVLEEKQILNSESLARLIQQKDAQMMDLFQLMKDSSNSESVPVGMISELLKTPVITPPPAPPLPVIRQVVVAETDSIVQAKPKKSFLKRLVEVFVPGKDSVKHIRTSVKVSSDSILETYADPLPVQENFSKIVVNRVQNQLKKKNDFFRDTIAAHQERIRLRELELTAQIDSLLKGYEKEVIHRAKIFDQQQKEQRNKSIRAIASIAVSAILLVAIFVFIIGRDITRSNRYRRELEQAKQRAEDLLQVREKLMLTITHDFKAPLSSVIGYTELLHSLLKDESQQTYLQNIQTSSQHLLQLVSQLLDFHRLDMQKEKVNAAPFVPYDLFEEAAAAFLPAVHDKGLEVHTRFSEELRIPRLGDALRIRQLVDNLTSNALKFTEKGSITLSAQMHNHRLVFSIRDTGQGIGNADRERIFRAFTRLPNAQGQEGAGLGLSIVKSIIKLLNGTIEVNSKKGKGTTFTVKLPLSQTKENQPSGSVVPKERKENAPVLNSLQGLRILLIDDDKIQLQLTRSMLARHGIHAEGCTQVQALIDHLRENTYDYLITDIQMPAISGFDLLKLLRSSQLPSAQKIPVIAATAQSNVQCQDFIDLGFVGCLHKPFSLAELSNLLKRKVRPEKSEENNENTASKTDKEKREHLQKTIREENKTGRPKRILKENSILRKNTAQDKPVRTPNATESNLVAPDFEALTAFSEGDEADIRHIRLSFLRETEKHISALENALYERNAEQISRIAHKQLTLFTLIRAEACIPLLIFLEKADPATFSLRIKNITAKLIDAEHHLLEIYRQRYPDLT